MTAQEVIDRAYSIMGDPDGDRWTPVELLVELNGILLELGHELELFKDDFSIDIFDGQREYEYDESITEVIQLRSDGYAGQVVFPSSLRQLKVSGKIPPVEVSNAFASGITVAFQSVSSYGKIVLDPTPSSSDSDLTASHVWTA